MAPEQVVRVDELSRHIGDKVAVDQGSFDIARSEVFGFLGPNGGGSGITDSGGVVVTRYAPEPSTFAFFIFLFISSVFFPQSSALLAIRVASLANPMTYTTDIFRAGLFNAVTSTVSLELGMLAVETAAMFVIAVVAFRRIWVRATGSHFRSPPRPMS